jgi:hypothetical protein
MPRPLYPRGKSPRYPSDRTSSGSQSQSGRRGEVKILDPTGTRNSDPSVVQRVASRYTDYAFSARLKVQELLYGSSGKHEEEDVIPQ